MGNASCGVHAADERHHPRSSRGDGNGLVELGQRSRHTVIELAAGPWRAALRPEIGGCLAALDREEVPVLRTMAEDADHPLQSACFPLVPFCNRVAEGRFTWRGHNTIIAPNLPPQRHPLHGLGWLRQWRAVRRDATSALLEHTHDGTGEWPWAYVAHQHVALDDAGCTVRLMLQNCGAEPFPAGLGLHPYFRRTAHTVITFEAEAMLGIDGELLPDGSQHRADALARWSSGARPPATSVDHCFTGWRSAAAIADEVGIITVRGFGTPHCHVYAPQDGEVLCIEPVNHTPDALNRAPQELTLLPPGCAAGIAMRIEAGPS